MLNSTRLWARDVLSGQTFAQCAQIQLTNFWVPTPKWGTPLWNELNHVQLNKIKQKLFSQNVTFFLWIPENFDVSGHTVDNWILNAFSFLFNECVSGKYILYFFCQSQLPLHLSFSFSLPQKTHILPSHMKFHINFTYWWILTKSQKLNFIFKF